MKAPLGKKLVLKSLEQLRDGYLELVCPGETRYFGRRDDPLHATVAVHNERFFRRALFDGDVGMGESFVDGDWSSPDLVSVIRLAVRNMSVLVQGTALSSLVSGLLNRVQHRLRRNTISGSRCNIHRHYDLGNDFFRLFLDRNMLYSCAWYERPDDSLDTAQVQKMERICRKLQLGPGDHVLEIGSGWGAFAVHAARNHGCRVTTTTISREQHDLAHARFAGAGLPPGQIELLFEDYRDLRGAYDKIVSIEMFEAVGLEHYRDYFVACDRLLKPDGSMLLQTITMNEQSFPAYSRGGDWIQKYIFPGGNSPPSSRSSVCSRGRPVCCCLTSRILEGTTLGHSRPGARGSTPRCRRCARWASTSGSSGCGISTWPSARGRSKSDTSVMCSWCWPRRTGGAHS